MKHLQLNRITNFSMFLADVCLAAFLPYTYLVNLDLPELARLISIGSWSQVIVTEEENEDDGKIKWTYKPRKPKSKLTSMREAWLTKRLVERELKMIEYNLLVCLKYFCIDLILYHINVFILSFLC